METVFFPFVLAIDAKPPAAKQELVVDIGRVGSVVSTLSSKVSDPPLNLLPTSVCTPVRHRQVCPDGQGIEGVVHAPADNAPVPTPCRVRLLKPLVFAAAKAVVAKDKRAATSQRLEIHRPLDRFFRSTMTCSSLLRCFTFSHFATKASTTNPDADQSDVKPACAYIT
jgi:hypothetical protein